MRKLLPFFLAFAIIICFAACKDKDEPTNPVIGTSSPSGSSDAASSSSAGDASGVTNPSAENVKQTYVLTTTPDMTVPSVATTPFNPANEIVSSDPFTSQTVTTDFNLTVAPITAPVVNSSALPSVPTVTSSAAGSSDGASSASSKTTASKTEQPVTSVSTKTVNIMDAGVGLDGSGKKIIYSIDPSCGSFKSNSTVISITVDGEDYDNIPCKISATNLDASGCQQIFIDLSGVDNLESGSTVSFSVPAAFLTSKDGKTSSRSFGNTIVV